MDIASEEVEKFRAYLADPAARAAFVEMKAQHAEQGAHRQYEHVLRYVGSRPWAATRELLAIIVDVLTYRVYEGRLTAEAIESRVGAVRRDPSTAAPRGVARIPISGVLVPKASAFNDMSGGTSTEQISGMLASAMASPDVASIILDIDSQGGLVDGIPELAAEIRAARERKPIVAVANTEAASAAYWLASQATRVVASPSARVGSIGVITAHEDRSQQAEGKGVKTTLISAGKYKDEGSPFAPLSDEGYAHMKSMVDEFYGMFVDDVAAGRGVKADAIRDGYGEGRILTASQARDAGLVDEIGTLEQTVGQEMGRAMAAFTSQPIQAETPRPTPAPVPDPDPVPVSDLDELVQALRGAEAGVPGETKESEPTTVSEKDAMAARIAALTEG